MELDAFPRINRVLITGFLQQDPELRHTPSGVAVASFRIRVGKLNRDRRGAARETLSYVTLVTWQDLAQRICREAKNGQAIYAEGSLHTRSFTAATGDRRNAVEIYAETMELLPYFLTGTAAAQAAPAAERPEGRKGRGRRGAQRRRPESQEESGAPAPAAGSEGAGEDAHAAPAETTPDSGDASGNSDPGSDRPAWPASPPQEPSPQPEPEPRPATEGDWSGPRRDASPDSDRVPADGHPGSGEEDRS